MPHLDRDQSRQAVDLGESKLSRGDVVGARRFAQKALALDPSSEAAREFERKVGLVEANGGGGQSSSAGTNGGMRHRKEVKKEDGGGMASTPSRPAPSTSATYTKEQVAIVKRVRSNEGTAYYSILEIEKTASDGDIKKAYRKLALQLHPDKNPAPGATEAFKMVSKAFTVLADADKRATYDRFGGDPESRFGAGTPGPGASAASGMGRGGMRFGGSQEVSPEDLFNAFFGGGQAFGPGASFSFGSGPAFGFQQFGGPRVRRTGGPRSTNNGPSQETPIWASIAPIIFFIVFSLFSMIISSDGGFSSLNPWSSYVQEPRFGFRPDRELSATKLTSPPIQATYYVNPRQYESWMASEHVRKDVERRLKSFERKVEGSFLRVLASQCQMERENQQRDLQDEFGLFGIRVDREKVKKIQQRRLPNCERLRSLGSID